MKKTVTFFLPAFIIINAEAQNVGIGTVSPQAKLHVFSTDNTNVLSETSGASKYAGFEAKTNAGLNDNLIVRKWMPGSSGTMAGVDLANLSQVVAGVQAGGLMVGVANNNPLYFTTNNIERMRIAANGYVGIGINAPNTMLNLRSTTDNVLIRAQAAGADFVTGVQLGGDFGTTEFVRFNSAYPGSIAGIPLANISSLYASGGTVLMGNSTDDPFYFLTNGAVRMKITGGGLVGINIPGSSISDHSQLRVERGSGAGISTSGEKGAILGISQNTAAGSGLFGVTNAPRTGAIGYAGVTGFNLSAGTERFGVIGQSSGMSSGAGYSAGVGGYGDYGVLGYSQSNTGAGVIAQHSAGKTALEINNGFIKVSGSTGNKTAFVVTTATGAGGNTAGNNTAISYNNPLPADIVIVTHNWQGNYMGAIGVYWNVSEWRLFREDGLVMPNGEKFNVIVIKQ